MRLVYIVLSVLLLAGFLGFVVTNMDARVGVTLWQTRYEDVSVHLVVLLSLAAGILYMGIIGIAQGVQLRLTNRRLAREIQKLETELNYLRTQPVERDVEGSAEAAPGTGESGRTHADAERTFPPSAPVYGGDEQGDETDDDDAYSGGRAV